MYLIKKLFNPEIFQGRYKRKKYFEGWYFKFIDKAEKSVYAVIPGVSYGMRAEDRHAFIQVIDAVDYKSCYFKFDFSSFKYSQNDFNISIGDNTFTRNGMILDLKREDNNEDKNKDNNEKFEIKGAIRFIDIVPFPKTIFSPGIMGPFTFIPFMECYHGIINIHHRITGSLSINNEIKDFTGGSGYIEKDWGRSFPESWVWIQSNHFNRDDISVMFSMAKIPYLHMHFTGFVSFLRIGGRLYRFATYTGAKIRHFTCEDGQIEITAVDRHYTMTISGKYRQSGKLMAPQNGLMHREIAESISSEIEATLQDNKGMVIFHGTGKNVGMEIVDFRVSAT